MDDTVAVAGDSVSGERARVRSAASPRGERSCVPARGAPAGPPRREGVPPNGLGDDEREVMVALELVGGAVPERGVQPSPVVELLDVLEDRAARLLVGGERSPAQPLLLQRGEEAFLRRVVMGLASAAVGLRDPVRAARGAERHRGVLPGPNRSTQHGGVIEGIVTPGSCHDGLESSRMSWCNGLSSSAGACGAGGAHLLFVAWTLWSCGGA